MRYVMRVLCAFVFLIAGCGETINPDNPARILADNAFSWAPDGVAGLSGARAVIGGHFIGLAAVGVYAFIKAEYRLFYVIAISEFCIAMGRVISLGVDGYDARVLMPLGIELYAAGAMFCAAKFLKNPA